MGIYWKTAIWTLLITTLFTLSSCTQKMIIRYDSAPAPMDSSVEYPSMLLGYGGSFHFGITGFVLEHDESVTGSLDLYTPIRTAIGLHSRECMIEKSQLTEQGGSFGFSMGELYPDIQDKVCVLRASGQWQVPANFDTQGHTIHGTHGYVYFVRLKEGIQKATVRHYPQDSDGSTFLVSKFRESTPLLGSLGYRVEFNGLEYQTAQIQLFGCGTTYQAQFTGGTHDIPFHEVFLAGASVGECLISGGVRGTLLDGTEAKHQFFIGRLVYAKGVRILAGIVELRDNQICYQADDSVSMIVYVESPERVEVKNELQGCFNGTEGAVAMYTAKGRSYYAFIRNGTIQEMN